MAITFLNHDGSRRIATDRDGSRRIATDRDGSRRIATDHIVEVRPKKNGDHSGGEILAYFGVHRFCGRMSIFFFNSRYRGGLGPGLYMLANVLPSPYQIFYEIFLNLTHYFSTYKGFKILKADKIQTFQIDYLSHFLISGGTMIKICTV